jgi:hypothetical protein
MSVKIYTCLDYPQDCLNTLTTYLKINCTSKYQLKLGKCFECFTFEMKVYVMKYRNNRCLKAWNGHMSCIKMQKKKNARSHIRPKGYWNHQNYMLHTPHMTQVGNIVVLPIIAF